MKAKLFVYLFLISLLGWGVTACDDDDDHHNKELTVTIASEKFEYDGDYLFFPYWARVEGESEWRRFENINGFVHEEGYETILRVWQEKWHDGEVADASMYRYKLLEVLSKVKKDTENFPPQMFHLYISSERADDPELPFYASVSGLHNMAPFPPIEGFIPEDGKAYLLRVNRNFNGSDAPSKFTYSYIETVKENPEFY